MALAGTGITFLTRLASKAWVRHLIDGYVTPFGTLRGDPRPRVLGDHRHHRMAPRRLFRRGALGAVQRPERRPRRGGRRPR